MKFYVLLPFWILLISLAKANEAEAAKLPKKISELQQLIKQNNRTDAHKKTVDFLGKPARDIGSGYRIEQWDVDGGTLTFHQAVGPIFRSAKGQVTWLIPTKNKVSLNILSGFEMYSREEHDPNKNGGQYWLGNIKLNPSGQYKFQDSGQFKQYKKVFPTHFFAKHTTGSFQITYPKEVKPTDVLETISDKTEICKITFNSGDKSKVFSIITSKPNRRLSFESDNQVFRMSRGWTQYWSKKSK